MSPHTQSQLSAMASAADRRNRPAAVPIIAVFLLLGGLFYAALSARGYFSAQRTLNAAVSRKARIQSTLAQIEMHKKSRNPEEDDLKALYPQAQFMVSQIENVAAMTWGVEKANEAVKATASQPAVMNTNSKLSRHDATFTIVGERSLDDIFAWLEEVQNHEHLSRKALFIADLELSPRSRHWYTQVRFRVYEANGS